MSFNASIALPNIAQDSFNPAIKLLREASLWLDAQSSIVGEPRAINKGTGDTTGKSGAVIYNNVALMPGVVGNYLTVPHAANLIGMTDLELVARVSSSDWTAASNQRLISKRGGTDDYEFFIETTGVPWMSVTGTIINASATPPLVDGTTYWLKCTYANASGNVYFYYAADQETEPSSWTQIGTVRTIASGKTFVGTSVVGIGQIGGIGANPLNGSVRRAIIRNGIGGSTVLDVALAGVPNWANSFTATTGQTVTLVTTAAAYGAPSALDAKYGSALGAYIYNGQAHDLAQGLNNLSVPDAANLGVPSYDISFYVTPTGTGANMDICGHAVRLSVYIIGSTIVLYGSSNGVSYAFSNTSSTYIGPGWYRLTLLPDDGAGNRVFKVYRDLVTPSTTVPTSWGTEVGTQTTAGAYTLAAGTGTFFIGHSAQSAGTYKKSIARFIMKSAIGGSDVLDVNLAAVPNYATSFLATTGQTVTLTSTSSDTNDPLLLAHDGRNYIAFPQNTNSALGISDSTELDISGDLEMVTRVRFRTGALTDGVNQAFMSKHGGGVLSAYQWTKNNTGHMHLRLSSDGSAVIQYQSSVTMAVAGVPENSWVWLKITADLDNGANSVVNFSYSSDQSIEEPTSWTPIGTTLTGAILPSIFNTTTALSVAGYTPASWNLNADLTHAIIRNGIAGPTVFKLDTLVDVISSAATSFTATSGQTVTVYRSVSGRKTVLVTRPVWLFGTDDFLDVADNSQLDFTNSDSFTVIVVARAFNLAQRFLMSKRANTGVGDAGYCLELNATPNFRSRISDGVTLSSGFSDLLNYTTGELSTFTAVRDRSNSTLYAFQDATRGNNTADTVTTGDLSNALSLRIGALGSASYADIEVVAAAVFRRALTDAEVALINTYYRTA